MTHDEVTAALSPDLPQIRDRAHEANLAAYLRRLDPRAFAALIGSLQAEASERRMLGAIRHLGAAQSAAQEYVERG